MELSVTLLWFPWNHFLEKRIVKGITSEQAGVWMVFASEGAERDKRYQGQTAPTMTMSR